MALVYKGAGVQDYGRLELKQSSEKKTFNLFYLACPVLHLDSSRPG